MSNQLPHSLPKGVKRRLVGLSEKGLANKQKRKNTRSNQWKGKDFTLFGIGDPKKTIQKKTSQRAIRLKRGDHDEDFAHLPVEIYFHICLFLKMDDKVVKKSLLLICKEISCKMLGVSSLKEMEREKVKSSSYYELLTFLSIRNEIDRFSSYLNSKKKFINIQNDLEKESKKIKQTWNQLHYNEQLELYYSERSNEMKKQIRNPTSEFSASKVFYRLENAIRDLNKYFPHWLSSKREFNDMSLMTTFIRQHRNVEQLYETLVNVKKVGIPVVSFADDEFEFNENLDWKINSILFDSNRFKSSKPKERNWKVMFENQLEKRICLDFTEQVFRWTKFYILKQPVLRRGSYLEPLPFECQPLEEIMKLAARMNQTHKYFYLFDRNYAHGTFKLQKTFNRKQSLVTPRKNDFMSLYQHTLGRLYRHFWWKNSEIAPSSLDIIAKFTFFMIEQWKEYYLFKFPDSKLTEKEIFYEFLKDGPRGAFTNAQLMDRIGVLIIVLVEFPQFNDKGKSIVTEVLAGERIRYRHNGKFKVAPQTSIEL